VCWLGHCVPHTATERPKRYRLRTRWRQTLPQQPSGCEQGRREKQHVLRPQCSPFTGQVSAVVEIWRGLAEERGQGLRGSEKGRYQWKMVGAIL